MMNEHEHPARCEIAIKKGERLALCRCWKSSKFPYCDGSHRDIEDSVGPIIVQTDSLG